MKYVFAIASVAVTASLMACGGKPDNYEGASNTDPVIEDGACQKLASCCAGLPEADQSMCLGSARGGEASECTRDLEQMRSAGTCQ